MEAYRDQYATLFNNGRHVVVLGISVDPDTALINWFREIDTPIMAMSDAGGTVSRTYQALNESTGTDARHLYVLDKTGRVTYKAIPFRVLAQDDYDRLAQEIDKLAPAPDPGDGAADLGIAGTGWLAIGGPPGGHAPGDCPD